MNKKGVSTENYRGVRDFYPDDMFIQNYIFDTWKKTTESFGYREYNASILELSDLYKSKTSEEIVNEQTYTFIDRGDREVTLRPEMTPTLARMIAKKQRELIMPVRWYSIPNVFRYEKPQRGRLREHFQLNVDMFGIDGIEAEIEMISVAYRIMKNFGASDSQFVIYINDRRIINDLFDAYEIEETDRAKVSRTIDKKDKISKSAFKEALNEILGSKTEDFIKDISSPRSVSEKLGKENKNLKNFLELIESLYSTGIANIEFKPLLMRGFDYYTGVVFEIFDRSSENNRSLFGGGRFDKLLEMFGSKSIPAIGFGMGDVTTRDFLETHNLLPKIETTAHLCICNAGVRYSELQKIANKIRSAGVNVIVNASQNKVGDQIKKADKKNIPFVTCIGENELDSGVYEIKELSSGETQFASIDKIASIVNPHTKEIKPS